VVKSNQIKLPCVSAVKLFDAQTVTRDQLVGIAAKFHRGSMSDYIVGLLQQIAELRGFAPLGVIDLEPNQTHVWAVRAYDTKEDVWTKAPLPEMSSEVIDFMCVNGSNKWVGLHYFGRRPEPVDVAKKIKEIGARTIGS
jgi:hypothetical protein